jgi:2'-5' RNA ligase
VTRPALQSALIVEVPEAEPAVARHRDRFDASATHGVPAHITVLFPFMPPEMITPPVSDELGHLFARISRFRFRLDRTSWFGQDVLWLGPREPGPFRALTECVYQAFPAFPPYQGEFDDVIPHLTVGHGQALDDLRAAEESIQTHLPIDAHATAVSLITQQAGGGRWIRNAAFSLK